MFEFVITMTFIVCVILTLTFIVSRCFGPMYTKCPICGTKTRVSDDGWFWYHCNNCGHEGKCERPF